MTQFKKIGFFRLSKRLKITGLVLAIVILVVVLAFRTIQGPSKGVIKEPTESKSSSSFEPESLIRHDGQHISFAYPERYIKRAGEDLPPSVLESYRLIAPGKPGAPSWTIAVTVYHLPSGNLTDSSSYKIRVDSPSQYIKSISSIKDRQAIFFKKSDGSETVVFFQTPAKLTAIGFTGGVHQPEASQDFDRVLNSLEWL